MFHGVLLLIVTTGLHPWQGLFPFLPLGLIPQFHQELLYVLQNGAVTTAQLQIQLERHTHRNKHLLHSYTLPNASFLVYWAQ